MLLLRTLLLCATAATTLVVAADHALPFGLQVQLDASGPNFSHLALDTRSTNKAYVTEWRTTAASQVQTRLVARNPAAEPQYVASALNGVGGIFFNGVQAQLATEIDVDPTRTLPLHAFVVAERQSPGANVFQRLFSSANQHTDPASNDVTLPGWSVSGTRLDDGTELPFGTRIYERVIPGNDASLGRLTAGSAAQDSFAGQYMLGEVVLWRRALSGEERAQVLAYLRAKWRIGGGPLSRTSLAVWLDAADEHTVRLQPGTTEVVQWFDKSGANAFASNVGETADRGRRPTWVPLGLNMRPILRFDGGDFVTLSDDPRPLVLGGYHVFAATNRPSVGIDDFQRPVSSWGGAASGENYDAPSWAMNFPWNDRIAPGHEQEFGPTILVSSGSDGFVLRNIALGSQRGNGWQSATFATFDIGELLVYSRRLRDFEEGEVIDYLKRKWHIDMVFYDEEQAPTPFPTPEPTPEPTPACPRCVCTPVPTPPRVPMITDRLPGPGAVDVALDVEVIVHFDVTPLKADSVHVGNVQLRDVDGNELPATVALLGTDTISLRHANMLELNTTYVAWLGMRIENVFDEQLGENVEWSFTTIETD